MMTPGNHTDEFRAAKPSPLKKTGGDNTDDVITLFGRLAALTTSLNYAGSVYAWVTSATTV
jgi:hypothetical protein